MKGPLFFIALICLSLAAFIGTNTPIFTQPANWPAPVYDLSKNPLKAEKVLLGRALFYDPILSKNGTISCASCHSQYTAFAHADHALSHGIDDRTGTRNAPALMNLAWQKTFMWDGAINHLDMQSLAPITHPDEMGETIEHVVAKLQQSKLYTHLFYEAFGDSLITGANTLKAISQFMLTLVSANSKYDSVMRKQTVFTVQENKGYKLFQKNCSSCHTEPLFSSFEFENNGLSPDPDLKDIGRAKITGQASDSMKFKTPSLRNIEFSQPYMHDGRFKKLRDVLQHYSSDITYSKTLSPALQKKIVLSANDKVDIIAFLLTLTDKQFLFDPAFSYPKSIFSAPPKD